MVEDQPEGTCPECGSPLEWATIRYQPERPSQAGRWVGVESHCTDPNCRGGALVAARSTDRAVDPRACNHEGKRAGRFGGDRAGRAAAASGGRFRRLRPLPR